MDLWQQGLSNLVITVTSFLDVKGVIKAADSAHDEDDAIIRSSESSQYMYVVGSWLLPEYLAEWAALIQKTVAGSCQALQNAVHDMHGCCLLLLVLHMPSSGQSSHSASLCLRACCYQCAEQS